MGIAQGGGALLRGEPLLLRRGGEPSRPGFPSGKRERGFDSLLPQALVLSRRYRIRFFLIQEQTCLFDLL